jgi:hypothetical protein
MNKFTFLKAFNSPFKRPKLNLYIGKVAIGTPYFFPRKWVKGTPKLINEAVIKYIQKEENYNKLNPNYARKIKSYNELYEEKKNYSYAVPKKIGFDFIGLGWKLKWDDTDYRFEWSPVWSFVFFKWQIAITFNTPEPSNYWEAWLYYQKNTDKTKSKLERIQQCMKEFSLLYTVSTNGNKETIDYYTKVLKTKYLKK